MAEPRDDPTSSLDTSGARHPLKEKGCNGPPRDRLSLPQFWTSVNRPITPGERLSLTSQFPSKITWSDKRVLSKLTKWYTNPTVRCATLARLKRLRSRHAWDRDEPLSLVNDKQLIYAIYDITRSHRLYVGQTAGCAYDRFRAHVQKARQVFRVGAAKYSSPFHKLVAKRGWNNLRLFPLERVDGKFEDSAEGLKQFRTKAAVRETFWKRTLHAFIPKGYCLEHKSGKLTSGASVADPHALIVAPKKDKAAGRVYGSRDYERKVISLLARIEEGGSAQSTIPRDLVLHKTKNVEKMLETLGYYDPNHWPFPNSVKALKDYLWARLPAGRKISRIAALKRTAIIQLFLHKRMGDFGVNASIRNLESWESLIPVDTRLKLEKPPVLSFKYAKTTAVTLSNAAEIARMSTKTLTNFLAKRCNCCKPELVQYRGKDGHIMTTDMHIINNEKLTSLLSKGAKFRTTVHEEVTGLHPGDVVNEVIYQDLTRALLKWRKDVAFSQGWDFAETLTEWCSHIVSEVKRNAPQMTVPVDDDRNTLADKDKRDLRRFQRFFAITTVDKAAGNFAISCKKQYVLRILKELTEGAAYVASDWTEAKILKHGSDACLSFRVSVQHLARVPHAYATIKMHKDPTGLRHISGSGKAPLNPLSKWASICLKAWMPDIAEFWEDTALGVADIPGSPRIKIPGMRREHLAGKTGFVVESTEKFASLILKNQIPRRKRYLKNYSFQCFDFTTMYTCLPREDLILKVGNIVAWVWAKNAVAGNIEGTYFSINYEGIFEWTLGLPRKKHRSVAFSLGEFRELIRVIVDHSFVKFGGKTYHQHIGLPMGCPVSGWLANLICYAFELDFLQRHMKARRWNIARNVALNAFRYIDDLFLRNFPDFQRYIYLPEGIYPPGSLELIKTDGNRDVTYMDSRVSPCRRKGIRLSISDKRREPKFDSTDVIRYPHVETSLDESCLYNIVTSQMTRFSRLCSDWQSFSYNTALVLHDMKLKGYDDNKVEKRVRAFFHKNNIALWYKAKGSSIIRKRVRSDLEGLQNKRFKAGPHGKIPI